MTEPASRFRDDFGPFGDRIWLNCAHQGPLPKVAASAAIRAVEEKAAPHLIRDAAFDDVPSRLRLLLGRLIGRPTGEVILGNSASHGIHLLANGIRWGPGDEVLTVGGDFPANVLPWMRLRKSGVVVRQIAPSNGCLLQPDDLQQRIAKSTRLLCVSWVSSYTGWRLDLAAISQVCREHGVLLVVNASQGLGAYEIDLRSAPVDAIVCCGYKWLCGPYGTGFCWLTPELLAAVDCQQVNWWPLRDWVPEGTSSELPDVGCRQFDVFCTANYLNFVPWTESINYLLQLGVTRIRTHTESLVSKLVNGVDRRKYDLVSPEAGVARSSIVVLSHRAPGNNRGVFGELQRHGIDIAIRKKNLRLSPFIYNSTDEIELVVNVLNEVG